MHIQTIHGVDFSGAADAGRRIWIADGTLAGAVLTIAACRPAEALPGGGHARTEALAGLCAYITRHNRGLFGLDFPFSLPAEQIDAPDWLAFARQFADRYPDADSLRRAHGGQGRELRRRTDRAMKTPFAAANLRMYRQTYYGIRDLLTPLALAESARILPMQAHSDGLPSLIEVCPAVVLRRLGLRLPHYKARGEHGLHQRAHILHTISRLGVTLADGSLSERLLHNSGGDALDSVLAAFGTAQAFRAGALAQAVDPTDALEGRVYA
jgi:hypothetical protein